MTGGQCYVCGFDNQHALEEHHIIPTSLGGQDEGNTVLLCANCHRAVSSMYSRWFFSELWRIYDDMEHPPDLVKQNPPKGLKYNSKNQLVADYDDGFEDVIRAIRMLDRGKNPNQVGNRVELSITKVRDMENHRELYMRIAADESFQTGDLEDFVKK